MSTKKSPGNSHAEEVHELKAKLNLATQELKDLCYSVSHDLRTPLRHIHGFTTLLKTDHAEELSQGAKELLERVCSSTMRMELLIEGLLELSKLSRTEIHKQEIDLFAEAKQIAEICQKNYSQSYSFTVEPNIKIFGDQRLIRTLLENLISNAFKFSKDVPSPSVELGLLKNDSPAQTTFFIKDNGAGFDSHLAAKLFSPFQRFHSETEFPGIGMGLALVKKIVALHNGSIRSESKAGNGATFFVTLPD